VSLLQESARSVPAAEEPADNGDGPRPRPRRRALREIGLVTLLFLAYKLGRIAADGQVGAAQAEGRRVWRLERALHLPSEVALQHAVVPHTLLTHAANCYYAYVHFPAAAVCLVWMYVYRPPHYLWTRRMLAWLTAAALAVHLLLPLAPPRMLTAIGMIDTGRLYGPAVYGPPGADALTNQYAAMPSLHVGWALAVAVALIAATRGRARWLWVLHPVLTLAVVLVTGNHYWLDAIVAVALLGLVVLALPRPGRAARSGAGPAAGADHDPARWAAPAAPRRALIRS
jgi:PAP2 superfamily